MSCVLGFSRSKYIAAAAAIAAAFCPSRLFQTKSGRASPPLSDICGLDPVNCSWDLLSKATSDLSLLSSLSCRHSSSLRSTVGSCLGEMRLTSSWPLMLVIGDVEDARLRTSSVKNRRVASSTRKQVTMLKGE